MAKFDRDAILERMESLRRPSGAFIAAPTADYKAVWLRDHLYTAYCYYYLGQPYFEKLIAGIQVVFDIFKKYREKLIDFPDTNPQRGDFFHAKLHADTFEEITTNWGHHQLDAIGLFLHVVGDLDFKHIKTIRNDDDLEILELLVLYLHKIGFWRNPDYGMWEDDFHPHASSIGACVSGLSYLKRREILKVPQTLIDRGRAALTKILPNESPERTHDMSQFSLIWPYNCAGPQKDEILRRILASDNPLVQIHGLNRYWGDNYYRSRKTGISGQWPMGFFWLSIVYSQMHDAENAQYWFDRGTEQIIDNAIPELYVDDEPNDHTPLAWAHALALIAHAKLQPAL